MRQVLVVSKPMKVRELRTNLQYLRLTLNNDTISDAYVKTFKYVYENTYKQEQV